MPEKAYPKPTDMFQESAGKTTALGEETPSKQLSSTKKRLFSELPADVFKPPTNDRFNSMIEGIQNDELKEPLTLKRAPLNHEILELLELIRLDYKGKAEETKATEY